MEEKQVTWTANALAMVSDVYDFIERESDSSAASEYIDGLLNFGNELSHKSEHFSFCRNPRLQQKGYRCALYKKTYILIYRIILNNIDILAVIHSKRNPAIFEDL